MRSGTVCQYSAGTKIPLTHTGTTTCIATVTVSGTMMDGNVKTVWVVRFITQLSLYLRPEW